MAASWLAFPSAQGDRGVRALTLAILRNPSSINVVLAPPAVQEGALDLEQTTLNDESGSWLRFSLCGSGEQGSMLTAFSPVASAGRFEVAPTAPKTVSLGWAADKDKIKIDDLNRTAIAAVEHFRQTERYSLIPTYNQSVECSIRCFREPGDAHTSAEEEEQTVECSIDDLGKFRENIIERINDFLTRKPYSLFNITWRYKDSEISAIWGDVVVPKDQAISFPSGNLGLMVPLESLADNTLAHQIALCIEKSVVYKIGVEGITVIINLVSKNFQAQLDLIQRHNVIQRHDVEDPESWV